MTARKSSKKQKAAPKPKPIVKMTEGSAKARRSAARLAAVQVLYQMRQNDQNARTVLREFFDHRIGYEIDGDVLVPADRELLSEIVNGVEARREELEGIAAEAGAPAHNFSRLDLLLQCILLTGTWELLSNSDVDTGIIINDYLNVTEAFYEKGEKGLMNAMLDKVASAVR